MICEAIEYALYNYFIVNANGYQAVIPRVYKKFKIHECDLIVVTKSDYIYEVEIKTSVSDCKADLKKVHEHKDLHSRLKYQYFAIPKDIVEKCEPHIPERFGIFTIDNDLSVEVYRPAIENKRHRKITKGELINLLTTGTQRYYQLLSRWLVKEEVEEDIEENYEESEGCFNGV